MADPEQYERLSYRVGSVFTPGAPINERDLFAGRLSQVDQILNAISQRGCHATLYGGRGVGKTSLSNVLLEFLGGPGQFAFSRVNCDASDTYATLWRKALLEVSEKVKVPGFGFLRYSPISARLTDQLPEEVAPNDVRLILSALAKDIPVVIIFDEFDRLKDSKTILLMADTIKTLSDHSVRATILIIGVADSVDGLIKEHHSIERALVQVPMPRMSDDEISDIISRGLHKLGMSIEHEANQDIVSLSQGLPYITHLLSLHSARSALDGKSKVIKQNHITKGIERSVSQWQQSIKSAYYNSTRSNQPGNIYKEVLLACALAEVDDMGYFTAASLRDPLRIITNRVYNISDFAKHIKDLSGPARGGVLKRAGAKGYARYRIESPMMRPYIIMRGMQDKIISKKTLNALLAALRV